MDDRASPSLSACREEARLEEYPLAKRYGWRSPKKLQERSLEWHLENDEPDMLKSPSAFKRERMRFHEQKARRARRRLNGALRHNDPRRDS